MPAKKLILSVAVIIAITLSTVGTLYVSPWSAEVRADGNRSIPFQVTNWYGDTATLKEGNSCAVSLDILKYFTTDQQIVVKDESDRIIKVKTLSDGVLKASSSESGFFCNFDFSLDVPDAQFYTVYVNDERITTLSPDDFPIDPVDAIYVTID